MRILVFLYRFLFSTGSATIDIQAGMQQVPFTYMITTVPEQTRSKAVIFMMMSVYAI